MKPVAPVTKTRIPSSEPASTRTVSQSRRVRPASRDLHHCLGLQTKEAALLHAWPRRQHQKTVPSSGRTSMFGLKPVLPEASQQAKDDNTQFERDPTGRRLYPTCETAATAGADGPVHEQGDDCADDRADDARRLEGALVEVLPEQCPAQKASDEAADDAEQNGRADGHRVGAGDEGPSYEAGDE